MKRGLLCLIISLFLIISYKETSYAASDFTYTVVNGCAEITAYAGSATSIIIPNKIDNYKVTAIAEHAFHADNNSSTNSQQLKYVTISEGITKIGDFAFVGCINLVAVKLPSTLGSIGDQTFIGCSNLTYINIPPKVRQIGMSGYVFQETNIQDIVIPKNVESIASCTFRACKPLKQVAIYNDRIQLDENIFEYCSPDLVLYGNKGSTTETYAKNNNIKFAYLSQYKPLKGQTAPGTKVPTISFKLEPEYKVYVNRAVVVKVVVSPASEQKNIVFASLNPDIASVNNNGVVIGKKTGMTTIVVASKTQPKVRAKCRVTVINFNEKPSIGKPNIGKPTSTARPKFTKKPSNTTAPSSKPTIAPTAVPSIEPSDTPSDDTNEKESDEPSVEPTTSSEPNNKSTLTTGSGSDDSSNTDTTDTTTYESYDKNKFTISYVIPCIALLAFIIIALKVVRLYKIKNELFSKDVDIHHK